MTRAEIRFVINQALEHIEWLDHHANARSPKWNKKYEAVLRDLRKWMLKVIEAPVHLRELKPGERDAEDDDLGIQPVYAISLEDHQNEPEEAAQAQDPTSSQSDQDDDKCEEDD